MCPRWAVGLQCDPVDDCNAKLQCAYADPTGGGNCPISLRAFKQDVAYLAPGQVEALYGQVRDLRLATWVYKGDATATTRTGFLIDDVPGSPAVAPDGQHVDLYGYTSMTVAAIQAQAQRIDALEKKLAELEAQIAASKR